MGKESCGEGDGERRRGAAAVWRWRRFQGRSPVG